MQALLLLGGNIGDVETTMAEAVHMLGVEAGVVRATSRGHWTLPVGFSDERLFLNKAVLLETQLEPRALMETCLAIEQRLGRTRIAIERYTARTIDIDILLFDDRTMDEPGLQVPHPRMHERAFALEPAADVAPLWAHQRTRKTVLAMCDEVEKK
ncbi:MAG: 2-amino-4-hydroxy-6-hydroxymethyldihydropteridine diphosphokinase [Flavobacteriales bacterium]|nr:MAG: 2-amino-4-hydroxy-6-hydroxymethyldihydropteridine diphosphokinase [Flavobacteriales bacterium]